MSRSAPSPRRKSPTATPTYLERESHYVWGRRYLLAIEEAGSAVTVELKHNRLILRIKPGAGRERRRAVLDGWYRGQLRATVPELIAQWEPRLGVKVARFFVQHMKTRWGSCNHEAHTLRLNTELAKKPPQCLEYLVVHEMIHLIEPTHGPRFVELIDRFMPKWRHYRDELNRLPVRHEDWLY